MLMSKETRLAVKRQYHRFSDVTVCFVSSFDFEEEHTPSVIIGGYYVEN